MITTILIIILIIIIIIIIIMIPPISRPRVLPRFTVLIKDSHYRCL